MNGLTLYTPDDAKDARAMNAAAMFRKFRAAGYASDVAMSAVRAQFGNIPATEVGRGVGLIGRTRD